MARQLELELVMLYLKDGKVATMKLSKHRLAAADATQTANQPLLQGEQDATAFDDSSAEAFELISAPQHVLAPLGSKPQAVKC